MDLDCPACVTSENSAIEWTDHTFNPWWGCTTISPACAHRHAETWSKRLRLPIGDQHPERRFFGDAHWDEPLAWNKKAAREGQRRRVFCAPMADVFEDRADLDPWRADQWKLIEATLWFDWLLLTKRPENVGAMVPWRSNWPSNIWLGTTVENADWAATRIPALLQHSAVIRCLSCEPLLGLIDLSPWMGEIDWVIFGGESGHGARSMRPVWARSLRDQRATAGSPFVFEQRGDIRPATSSDLKARRIVLIAGGDPPCPCSSPHGARAHSPPTQADPKRSPRGLSMILLMPFASARQAPRARQPWSPRRPTFDHTRPAWSGGRKGPLPDAPNSATES